MTALTYVELFAGGGGLSLGLEMAGWTGLAHAEIEPHARAVLRAHWPDCRLDGDVSQLNGADYAGVTLLSGGSPCQDLSVAGKRKGMTEGSGTRSSLYFEQVRIRDESGAPYFLWENVLGAFSSNDGRDFAAVLSALVGVPITVPADGWQSAGVAAGPTGVAAWRVLDCQFFGPPQRRRRVFVLGARAGGVDPAEVLAVSEGLLGDSETCGQASEGAAHDARDGADGARADGDDGGGDGAPGAREGAGSGGSGGAVGGRDGGPGVVRAGHAVAPHLAVNVSGGSATLDPVMGMLDTDGASTTAIGNQTRGVVLAMDAEYNASDRVMGPLDIGSKSGGGRPTAVVSFAQNQRGELRTMDVAAQLTTGGGKPGEGYSAVLVHQDPVGYIAEITDRATGQVARVAQARAWDDNEWAWWGTGNGSCDCNRGDFAGVDGVPCDNGIVRRFAVRCLTLDGRELYADEPNTIAGPLSADADRGDQEQVVLTFDARGNGDGATVNTLAGDHQNRVTDYTALVVRQQEGKPEVAPEQPPTDPAAQTFRLVEFGEYSGDGTASAVKARDYKDATDLVLPVVAAPLVAGAHPGGANGQDAPRVAAAILAAAPSVGIPRRLMPIETERLQGWPDHWTAEGVGEDGTRYALSDTARYRLVGNGVASPVAAWIGWRLRAALEAQAALAARATAGG